MQLGTSCCHRMGMCLGTLTQQHCALVLFIHQWMTFNDTHRIVFGVDVIRIFRILGRGIRKAKWYLAQMSDCE